MIARNLAIALLSTWFITPIYASTQFPPSDTEIRILLIRDDSVTDAEVSVQRDFLDAAWINTSLSTSVTLNFVNNGQPIEFVEDPFRNPPFELSGDAFTQRNHLKEFVTRPSDPNDPSSPSLREIYAADLVVALSEDVFVPGLGFACGFAPQNSWLGAGAAFTPGAFGLDLDDRDNFYVALVSNQLTVGCRDELNLISHEFGHLLGAGHAASHGPGRGLYADSRANARTVAWYNSPIWVLATVLIAPGDAECIWATDPEEGECTLDPYFSDPHHYVAYQQGRNDKALDRTASSVANYVQSVPQPPVNTCTDGIDNDGDGDIDSGDPECPGVGESGPPPPPPQFCNSLNVPTNVEGFQVAECAINPANNITFSHYNVSWHHGCPEEVTHYEIWYNQPTTAAPAYGWDRSMRYTDVFVEGSPSRIRVRACGLAGCSGFSLSSFVAVDEC